MTQTKNSEMKTASNGSNGMEQIRRQMAELIQVVAAGLPQTLFQQTTNNHTNPPTINLLADEMSLHVKIHKQEVGGRVVEGAK